MNEHVIHAVFSVIQLCLLRWSMLLLIQDAPKRPDFDQVFAKFLAEYEAGNASAEAKDV